MPGIDLDALAHQYPAVDLARRQVALSNRVGALLRRMRKEARLSQAQVAAALEVTQPRIAQIESGRPGDAPSLNQIVAYATFCGFEATLDIAALGTISYADDHMAKSVA